MMGQAELGDVVPVGSYSAICICPHSVMFRESVAFLCI